MWLLENHFKKPHHLKNKKLRYFLIIKKFCFQFLQLFPWALKQPCFCFINCSSSDDRVRFLNICTVISFWLNIFMIGPKKRKDLVHALKIKRISHSNESVFSGNPRELVQKIILWKAYIQIRYLREFCYSFKHIFWVHWTQESQFFKWFQYDGCCYHSHCCAVTDSKHSEGTFLSSLLNSCDKTCIYVNQKMV